MHELCVNPRLCGTGEGEAQGGVLDNAKLLNAFQSPALFFVQCESETLTY